MPGKAPNFNFVYTALRPTDLITNTVSSSVGTRRRNRKAPAPAGAAYATGIAVPPPLLQLEWVHVATVLTVVSPVVIIVLTGQIAGRSCQWEL
jgi:hypothetical protein